MLYDPKTLWLSPESEANNPIAYHWLLELALNNPVRDWERRVGDPANMPLVA
jgi:hypothetical protein